MRALPVVTYKSAVSDDEIKLRQILNIDELQISLSNMHKDVKQRTDATRALQTLKHNAKTNVVPANFHLGDMVLVRRAQRKRHKLRFVWRGPRRIVKILSQWVYEVEYLLERKKETVHGRRLMWYRADREDLEISPALLEYATHSETTYQNAETLVHVRGGTDRIDILVQWTGLRDEVDQTWEPPLL